MSEGIQTYLFKSLFDQGKNYCKFNQSPEYCFRAWSFSPKHFQNWSKWKNDSMFFPNPSHFLYKTIILLSIPSQIKPMLNLFFLTQSWLPSRGITPKQLFFLAISFWQIKLKIASQFSWNIPAKSLWARFTISTLRCCWDWYFKNINQPQSIA